jgi:hypothetical protein
VTSTRTWSCGRSPSGSSTIRPGCCTATPGYTTDTRQALEEEQEAISEEEQRELTREAHERDRKRWETDKSELLEAIEKAKDNPAVRRFSHMLSQMEQRVERIDRNLKQAA